MLLITLLCKLKQKMTGKTAANNGRKCWNNGAVKIFK